MTAALKSVPRRYKSVPKRYKSNFLESLYTILETPKYQEIIRWSDDGTFFKVLNIKLLEERVLPIHYKHGRFSSFTRQLNIYDFRRQTDPIDSSINFWQSLFLRGSRENMKIMQRKQESKRKAPQTSKASPLIDGESGEIGTTDSIEGFKATAAKIRRSKSPKKNKIEQYVESAEKGNLDAELEDMGKKVKSVVSFLNEHPPNKDSRGNIDVQGYYDLFRNKLQKVLEFDKIEREVNNQKDLHGNMTQENFDNLDPSMMLKRQPSLDFFGKSDTASKDV